MDLTQRDINRMLEKNGITKKYADKEFQRAIELQAKWNGTTIEEEAAAYKSKPKKKYKNADCTEEYTDEELNEHRRRGGLETIKFGKENVNDSRSEVMDEMTRYSCQYWNKYILGIKNPCEDNECSRNCPNCRRKLDKVAKANPLQELCFDE